MSANSASRSPVWPRFSAGCPGSGRRDGKSPASAAAWQHLTVAGDHFSTLRAATVGCDHAAGQALDLHLNGQFTLLRAVIENASAALWLIEPAAHTERVLRRRQLAVGDIRNHEAVRAVLQQPGTTTRDQRLNDVRTIATAYGSDPKAALSRVNYEDIVRAAGAATTARPAPT
jgi:hypothetical protein